jgi:hypothetical protein
VGTHSTTAVPVRQAGSELPMEARACGGYPAHRWVCEARGAYFKLREPRGPRRLCHSPARPHSYYSLPRSAPGGSTASRSRRVMGFNRPALCAQKGLVVTVGIGFRRWLARSSEGTDLLRRGVYISPPPAPSTKHASPWLALPPLRIANDSVRLGEARDSAGAGARHKASTDRSRRKTRRARLQARLLSKQPNAVALTRYRHGSAASRRDRETNHSCCCCCQQYSTTAAASTTSTSGTLVIARQRAQPPKSPE